MRSRGTALACLLAACAAQAGCFSEPPSADNFHLATVAASPEHGLLFVAQPGRAMVDVLSMDAPPAFVARLASPEPAHILRLAVDRHHGRLWVAAFKRLEAYELPSLQKLRSYALPGKSYHDRFSDVALDSAGNAFVLARGGARVYRIDGGTLELEPWLELDERASDAALLLANRALASADDRYLFFPSPTSGRLLRVELRSKEVASVGGEAANLSCGLLFREHGRPDIRGLDCTGRWEAQIALDAAGNARVALRGEQRTAGTVTRFSR